MTIFSYFSRLRSIRFIRATRFQTAIKMTTGNPQSSTMAEADRKLEEIVGRYKNPQTASRAFDSASLSATRPQSRLSQAPRLSTDGGIAAYYAEMAEIKKALIQYADEHGKLSTRFSQVLSDDNLTIGEKIRIILYNTLGRSASAKQIQVGAWERKGEIFETLVDKIAEVMSEEHQASVRGIAKVRDLQARNISHMKYLEDEVVKELSAGYTGSEVYSEQQREVDRLKLQLDEVQTTLEMYEPELKAAQAKGDTTASAQVLQKMARLLEIKRDLRDGKYLAEGAVQETWRKILDQSEGVQSARGALAASEVNYVAINGLIDAYTKLEIKYRRAMQHMMPVFRIQARIAGAGQDVEQLVKSLKDAAVLTVRLMEANERAVVALTTEVQDLLQTPIYDTNQARAIEARLQGHLDQIKQMDEQWTQLQQTVSEMPKSGPGYARPV